MTESNTEMQSIRIGGFETVQATGKELAGLMLSDCISSRADSARLPSLVFSSNGQGIALAGRDPDFARVMDEATVIHADGMPVVLASKMTRKPLPERVATTDFFHDAALVASENGLKFFMLGATEKQNKAAVQEIERLYPDLEVVGRHHGYFGPDEDEAICRQVRESGADVLWVALGKPRQEEWSVRNRSLLTGVGWVKTCGGLYSFLAGDAPRAPRWMQRAGLEWLYRAAGDPKRLGWRYLTTNPYALYRLIRHTERVSQS